MYLTLSSPQHQVLIIIILFWVTYVTLLAPATVTSISITLALCQWPVVQSVHVIVIDQLYKVFMSVWSCVLSVPGSEVRPGVNDQLYKVFMSVWYCVVSVPGSEVGPGISDQFRKVFMSALNSSMISDPSYWPPTAEGGGQGARGQPPRSARNADTCPWQPPEGVALVQDDVIVSDLEAETTMDLTGPFSSPDVCDALNPYSLFNLPHPNNTRCCNNHDSRRAACGLFRDRSEASGGHSNGRGRWGRVREGRESGSQASSSSSEAYRAEGAGRNFPAGQRPCVQFDFPSDLSLPSSSTHQPGHRQDVHAKSRTLPPTSLATWTSSEGSSVATPMEADHVEPTPPTCLLLPGPCKKKCSGEQCTSVTGVHSFGVAFFFFFFFFYNMVPLLFLVSWRISARWEYKM